MIPKLSLASSLSKLGDGGLLLMVDSTSHPVSGARAISDGLVEVYPTDDPDERPYRFTVEGVTETDGGLEFQTKDRVIFRLFSSELFADRVLTIKPEESE